MIRVDVDLNVAAAEDELLTVCSPRTDRFEIKTAAEQAGGCRAASAAHRLFLRREFKQCGRRVRQKTFDSRRANLNDAPTSSPPTPFAKKVWSSWGGIRASKKVREDGTRTLAFPSYGGLMTLPLNG